ncbi:hypothetical protein [Aeromonas veronii]|uniref:hypothetical protein n=1 Tax=Aeromonas veronii TaxID=654 RepID=UPI0024452AE2|nr:hypothetical protein [Aeromonas veronii]
MSGCRERVVPDDGRNENRWVALFTAAVLLCGVVGIYSRQAPDTPVAQTPDLTLAGRQQLTELVIALDEAGFMASDGHWPALAAMEQALIPPFSEGGLARVGQWLLAGTTSGPARCALACFVAR